MDKIWRSVAFRLAVICGALVIGSVAVFSMAFYFATVGVMARNADTKIVSVSASMTEDAANRGLDAVARRIESTLTDGVDSDTEILLLTDANGKKIAGNISRWMEVNMPADQILDRDVSRGGGKSPSRVLLHQLPGGATLIVGRDMQDLNEVRVLIGRAVVIGAIVAPVSNVMFAWLTTQGPDIPALFIALGFNNSAQSFAGTCLIAYMSSLTSIGFTATQYALFSSLYSLPDKVIITQTGRMVEAAARSANDGGLFAPLMTWFEALPAGSFASGAENLGVSPHALAAGYVVFFFVTALIPAVIATPLAVMVARRQKSKTPAP